MTDGGDTHMGELGRFLTALVEAGFDFVVCGGIACLMHGISRVTNDLDICVRMDEQNLCRLVDAVQRFGLQPRIPEPIEALLDPQKHREWVEKKNAKVFTLVSLNTVLQIDVMLEYPVAYTELAQEATVLRTGELTFRVSSKEHLIAAKQHVQPPRKTDLRDIEDLLELIERERSSS